MQSLEQRNRRHGSAVGLLLGDCVGGQAGESVGDGVGGRVGEDAGLGDGVEEGTGGVGAAAVVGACDGGGVTKMRTKIAP